MTGHPGKNALYAILAWKFYQLNMAINIWQFTWNCDLCGANTAWCERKYDLLKPLSIPDWKWHEISMDFIIQLLELMSCINIMIIIDYLEKDSIIISVKQIDTEIIVKIFLNHFIWNHGLFDAIVLNCGRIFVGNLWKCLYQLLKIMRRLSTAFHSETDRLMKRMNAEVEVYL